MADGPTIPLDHADVSPAELIMNLLNDRLDRELVPAGVVVGGADDDQQQKGVIALMDAGNAKQELYAHLMWKRIQVRAMGPTLDVADRIGNHVFNILSNITGRFGVEVEDSEGNRWFIQSIFMAVGSSHHIDSVETYESLSFCTACIGSDPIPS